MAGILKKVLKTLSGSTDFKVLDQLVFDKIIGFRGLAPGVGTSTIVANLATSLVEKTNYKVCVLDTSFLHPTQYSFLAKTVITKNQGDILTFEKDISEILIETNNKNLFLASLIDRTLIDMLSTKDSEATIATVINTLKSYFDIILVDLPTEITRITTESAIQCNYIITVADSSTKCMFNLTKSLNTLASLGIPPAKCNRIILNKVMKDVITNSSRVLEEADLDVIGEIPFSEQIAIAGVTGKRVWSDVSKGDLALFNDTITNIIEIIKGTTPLNAKYTNIENINIIANDFKKKLEIVDKLADSEEVKDTDLTNEFEDDFVDDEIIDMD